MVDEYKDNLIMRKSYHFSLMVIELYKFLIQQKKEYVLSKQLLRCGTSIGANINEAQAAISKEARESKYWLMLLKDSGYIDPDKEKVKALLKEIDSIINITTKIVKSSQTNAK